MLEIEYPVFYYQSDLYVSLSSEDYLKLLKNLDEGDPCKKKNRWHFPEGAHPAYFIILNSNIGEKSCLEIHSPHPDDCPEKFPKELTDLLQNSGFKEIKIEAPSAGIETKLSPNEAFERRYGFGVTPPREEL